MNDMHTELLTRIENFCRRYNMSESHFGRVVCGDPSLLGRLRRGVSPTLRTVERIEAFMNGSM